jgi:hypothetical protein
MLTPSAALAALSLVATVVPLTPGTWWEYHELARERIGKLWSATDDTVVFSVRGRPGALLLAQRGGTDPGVGAVEIGEHSLRLGLWTGEGALPLPLVVGAEGPPMAEGLAGWRVEAEEVVEVPAGRFDAFRCGLRAPTSESVLWIAPGVGIVRETFGTPGEPPLVERELMRWKAADSPAE